MRTGRPRVPLLERLMSRVIKQDDGCWIFTGTLDAYGYGHISAGGTKGRTLKAHRVVFEALRYLVPEGLQLDHLCRVRHCVNPDHLEPVTPSENVVRGMAPVRLRERNALRRLAPKCGRGHLLDDENTYIKPSGYRACKTCRRAAKARYLARKAAVL